MMRVAPPKEEPDPAEKDAAEPGETFADIRVENLWIAELWTRPRARP